MVIPAVSRYKLRNSWGAMCMVWDNAFFADSKVEPLIWDQDPGDHPLMNKIPVFLQIRAARSAEGVIFASRRPAPPPKLLKIGIVRDGKRRATVPLNLSA